MKRYTVEFANSLITSYSVLNERGEVPQVCRKNIGIISDIVRACERGEISDLEAVSAIVDVTRGEAE